MPFPFWKRKPLLHTCKCDIPGFQSHMKTVSETLQKLQRDHELLESKILERKGFHKEWMEVGDPEQAIRDLEEKLDDLARDLGRQVTQQGDQTQSQLADKVEDISKTLSQEMRRLKRMSKKSDPGLESEVLEKGESPTVKVLPGRLPGLEQTKITSLTANNSGVPLEQQFSRPLPPTPRRPRKKILSSPVPKPATPLSPSGASLTGSRACSIILQCVMSGPEAGTDPGRQEVQSAQRGLQEEQDEQISRPLPPTPLRRRKKILSSPGPKSATPLSPSGASLPGSRACSILQCDMSGSGAGTDPGRQEFMSTDGDLQEEEFSRPLSPIPLRRRKKFLFSLGPKSATPLSSGACLPGSRACSILVFDMSGSEADKDPGRQEVKSTERGLQEEQFSRPLPPTPRRPRKKILSSPVPKPATPLSPSGASLTGSRACSILQCVMSGPEAGTDPGRQEVQSAQRGLQEEQDEQISRPLPPTPLRRRKKILSSPGPKSATPLSPSGASLPGSRACSILQCDMSGSGADTDPGRQEFMSTDGDLQEEEFSRPLSPIPLRRRKKFLFSLGPKSATPLSSGACLPGSRACSILVFDMSGSEADKDPGRQEVKSTERGLQEEQFSRPLPPTPRRQRKKFLSSPGPKSATPRSKSRASLPGCDMAGSEADTDPGRQEVKQDQQISRPLPPTPRHPRKKVLSGPKLATPRSPSPASLPGFRACSILQCDMSGSEADKDPGRQEVKSTERGLQEEQNEQISRPLPPTPRRQRKKFLSSPGPKSATPRSKSRASLPGCDMSGSGAGTDPDRQEVKSTERDLREEQDEIGRRWEERLKVLMEERERNLAELLKVLEKEMEGRCEQLQKTTGQPSSDDTQTEEQKVVSLLAPPDTTKAGEGKLIKTCFLRRAVPLRILRLQREFHQEVKKENERLSNLEKTMEEAKKADKSRLDEKIRTLQMEDEERLTEEREKMEREKQRGKEQIKCLRHATMEKLKEEQLKAEEGRKTEKEKRKKTEEERKKREKADKLKMEEEKREEKHRKEVEVKEGKLQKKQAEKLKKENAEMMEKCRKEEEKKEAKLRKEEDKDEKHRKEEEKREGKLTMEEREEKRMKEDEVKKEKLRKEEEKTEEKPEEKKEQKQPMDEERQKEKLKKEEEKREQKRQKEEEDKKEKLRKEEEKRAQKRQKEEDKKEKLKKEEEKREQKRQKEEEDKKEKLKKEEEKREQKRQKEEEKKEKLRKEEEKRAQKRQKEEEDKKEKLRKEEEKREQKRQKEEEDKKEKLRKKEEKADKRFKKEEEKWEKIRRKKKEDEIRKIIQRNKAEERDEKLRKEREFMKGIKMDVEKRRIAMLMREETRRRGIQRKMDEEKEARRRKREDDEIEKWLKMKMEGKHRTYRKEEKLMDEKDVEKRRKEEEEKKELRKKEAEQRDKEARKQFLEKERKQREREEQIRNEQEKKLANEIAKELEMERKQKEKKLEKERKRKERDEKIKNKQEKKRANEIAEKLEKEIKRKERDEQIKNKQEKKRANEIAEKLEKERKRKEREEQIKNEQEKRQAKEEVKNLEKLRKQEKLWQDVWEAEQAFKRGLEKPKSWLTSLFPKNTIAPM